MAEVRKSWRRKFLYWAGGLVLLVLLAMPLVVQFLLEPALRKGIHTLIVNGSDSLYTYKLGGLNASLLGGDVELQDLQITVDSGHYERMKLTDSLPGVTMEFQMQSGHVKGVGIFSFLLFKKLKIEEIRTVEANIRLIRQKTLTLKGREDKPLWKSIQPNMKSIEINKVRFDGLKLLFKNVDTSQAMKFQFDRVEARIDDIFVDSTAAADTNRVMFAEDIQLRMHDMKFRTPDSSYKMKAEWITYSTRTRRLDIDSFKLQPTLEKEDFYKNYGVQASLYYFEVDKARLVNFPLDRFLSNETMQADSIVLEKPRFKAYMDKRWEKQFRNKIGTYPHQKLLQAKRTTRIGVIDARNASVSYTEVNGQTGMEGTLKLDKIDLLVTNATNDPEWIRRNPVCRASASGVILGGSPITTQFRFYLDSTNGRFDVDGSIKNVTADRLNTIAIPMGNTEIRSLTIDSLSFRIRAEDFTAWSDVRMRYRNLNVVLRKVDEETGAITTRGFLTRILNRYVFIPSNPDASGRERVATNVRFNRLTTQSFFGVIWKSIYAGMQDVIMNKG